MKRFQSKLKLAKRAFYEAVQRYRLEFGLRLNSDNFCRQIYEKKEEHILYRQGIPDYFIIADKRLNRLQFLYKSRKLNRKNRKKNYLIRLRYYGDCLSSKMKRKIWKEQICRNMKY